MAPDSPSDYQTVVVGAGLCGLSIAHALSAAHALTTTRGLENRVTVLEKSRGVGGRIATRRTGEGKFDHGAQFYSLKPSIEHLHRRWFDAGLVKPWPDLPPPPRFAAPGGMTGLAKHLAKDVDVQLEKKVLEIRRDRSRWQINIENSEPLTASVLILTCPLPQSLEILKTSGIPFDSKLEDIKYAKALVALFDGVKRTAAHSTNDMLADAFSRSGYCENPAEAIFSISDQNRKGLTADAAWTVVMQPMFSDENFDRPEAEALAEIVKQIEKIDSNFLCSSAQLKKWRYSHPLGTYSDLFSQPQPDLFIAGDAFGGPSLNGAAKSAAAVLDEIANKQS